MALPTATIIAGSDFSANPAATRLPALSNPADLKLWCFPRAPGPTINLADGSILEELAGGSSVASGPIYRKAWVDFYGQGIGLETGVADGANGTLIVIAKAPGQSGGGGRASAPLIDNSTPSGIQFLLYNYADTLNFYVAGLMPGGASAINLTGGAPNCWGFYALTWQSGAGGGVAAYALTDNQIVTMSSSASRALGSNTFKMGSQPAGASAGATSECSEAFGGLLIGSSPTACLSADAIADIRRSLQFALAPDGLIF
jgi:hypothetical protein